MMDMNEILTGDINRLKFIQRFSTSPRIHNESVADHSFYVMFFSFMLAEDLITQGHVIDVAKLMKRALLHDIDEIFSGDFIRMFKHDNLAVKNAIDLTSGRFMRKFCLNYAFGEKILKHWRNSKAKDKEGHIIAYADFLSVLSYIWQEIHFGNTKMFEQIEPMQTCHNTFLEDEYTFLNEYWKDVQRLICELDNKRITEAHLYE